MNPLRSKEQIRDYQWSRLRRQIDYCLGTSSVAAPELVAGSLLGGDIEQRLDGFLNRKKA